MARRRSRRRKSSYSEDADSSGVAAEFAVEDLSPRARRLVEGGVIDLSGIVGSGDGGRITSGDILHAARVMEMEQSVARIETVGRVAESSHPEESDQPEKAPDSDSILESESSAASDEIPTAPPGDDVVEAVPHDEQETFDGSSDTTHSGVTSSSAAEVGGDVIEVPPSPWDAYNGSSDGLSESALPGAEQSWGEAEANIAAIAEEAAARVYGRPPAESDSPVEPISEQQDESEPMTPVAEDVAVADSVTAQEPSEESLTGEPDALSVAPVEPEPDAEPDVEPEPVEPESADGYAESSEQPTAVVAALSEIEAVVDPEPALTDEEPPDGTTVPESHPTDVEPQPEPREAMMDFGTLELVDPDSVWAEGAEDFAPWFLAHSKQLGDVLGLDAGLSDARQFTTKSATGVVGRDDSGDDVVVVSSQESIADDSDLGRALGMAASSGAAAVALVSAKFNDEQLKALSWLNNQTKSGVRWYAIEMRVVRIADSPAAMLFDLVASPPNE